MRAIIRCALAILLAAGAAGAQQPGQQMKPADPLGDNLFPPELIMQNQHAIGMQDAQRTAIRSEIYKAQVRFLELQMQLEDAMEGLSRILKQEQVSEEQVLAQLDKVLSSEREIKRAQITLMVRLKNKLTPEQQQQLRFLRKSSADPQPRPAN